MAEPLTQEQLAQDLFDQARTLLAQGDVSRACKLFAESQRLDPGGGTYLNLALCHQKEGKLGTAQFELSEALSMARRDKRSDREEIATAHLAEIAPRVPRLIVTPPAAGISGLVVELDDVLLAPAALLIPLPVDPGSHTLRASARGHVTWTWDGTLAEGEERRVQLPALERNVEPPAPPPPPPPVAPRTITTRSFSTASYVTFGVSAALLVTSGVTGAVSLSQKSIYENDCVPARHYCKDGGAGALSDARTFAWVSTATLLGGAAAAATGFLLPRNVHVAPQVEPGSARLTAFGSF
jgi:hypothetical protein